jgi:hypothetical protein
MDQKMRFDPYHAPSLFEYANEHTVAAKENRCRIVDINQPAWVLCYASNARFMSVVPHT